MLRTSCCSNPECCPAALQDHPAKQQGQQQQVQQQELSKPHAASRAAQSRRRCLDFSSADPSSQRSLLMQHDLPQHSSARQDSFPAALPAAERSGSQGLRQLLPGMSVPKAAPISTFIPANHQQQQHPGVQLDCSEQLPQEAAPAALQQADAAAGPMPQASPAQQDAASAQAAEEAGRQLQQRKLRQRKADASKSAMEELYDELGCEDEDDTDPDAEEWTQEQLVLQKQRRSQRARRHAPPTQRAAPDAPCRPAAAPAGQQEQGQQQEQEQQGGQQQQAGSSSRPLRSSRASYLARADGAGTTPDRRLSFAGASLGVLPPYTPDDRTSK
jgi:hypothetical protein